MTVSQLLFQIPNVPQGDPKILIFGTLSSIFWVLPWKGVALWRTAHNSHKREKKLTGQVRPNRFLKIKPSSEISLILGKNL